MLRYLSLTMPLAFLITVGSSGQARAQSLQMGADNRSMSEGTCISAARKALSDRHLRISGDRSTVWGSGTDVVVFVHCVPLSRGVHIVVAATSESSEVAERYRNEIRTQVFGTVAFD